MANKLTLTTYEMTKLTDRWWLHRRDCNSTGDARIEYALGGGIGTRVLVTCGCGKEMDVTDYESW